MSDRRPSGAVYYRGERGGLASALAYIRQDEGLSRRKAKRRFLRHVWRMTSPGLQMLARAQAGLNWYGTNTMRPVSKRELKRREDRKRLQDILDAERAAIEGGL